MRSELFLKVLKIYISSLCTCAEHFFFNLFCGFLERGNHFQAVSDVFLMASNYSEPLLIHFNPLPQEINKD